MRINFKRFTVLFSLVLAEWVKLESPKDFLEKEPSTAWIKYQQERIKHNTKIPSTNFINVSKLVVDSTVNNHSESFINGKIELPKSRKLALLNDIKQPISRSSLNGFVYFLKNLQGKLVHKGKSTIMDKINLLNQLKNNIIKNIGMYFLHSIFIECFIFII